MKILVQSKSRCFTIPLPGRLVLNRPVLRLVLHQSPGAADRLLRELRRLKATRGPWELVRVEEKNGEVIRIIL